MREIRKVAALACVSALLLSACSDVKDAVAPKDPIVLKANITDKAAAKVPAAVPKGEKIQTAATDWRVAADQGDGTVRSKGFPCLKFQIDTPQYYQYDYTTTVDATTGTFTAYANGDVNGNGIESQFNIGGAVRDGRLVLTPAIGEKNPEE